MAVTAWRFAISPAFSLHPLGICCFKKLISFYFITFIHLLYECAKYAAGEAASKRFDFIIALKYCQVKS